MQFIDIIAKTISLFGAVLKTLVFVRIIISLFPGVRNARGILGTAVGIVFTMTDPILTPIRRVVQKSPLGGVGIIDFSAVFSFFLIDAAVSVIIFFLGLAV